ncbi:MAG: TAT-variant-translocated molybdopterin oxidoreductase [Anaerolineae bacterium]|nr:TAT-variant-translocated molybdopterin oxidoreductase [Anaerolineae bacterium]
MTFMRKNFDIPSLRQRLAGLNGPKYWRCLEEIAETEAFQDFLKREFPQGADQWPNPVSRRNFLKLMGASLALGGLTACTGGLPEKIVPYVDPPEAIVPGGKPLFFATAMPLGGLALGLLAESHQGRPTKLEGNPDHPASLGATNTFAQASVLELYDPDRAQIITQAGAAGNWTAFISALNGALEQQRSANGAGLRLLTETVTSPTLANQMQAVLGQFPQAQWHQYEPINRDNPRQGALMAFGRDVNPVYHFDRAEVVLSLEADFLGANPAGVRYAHDFSQKRRVRAGRPEMNRLYAIESTPTVTGAMADHHRPVRPSQVAGVILALAAAVGLNLPGAETELNDVPPAWISALANDLQAHRGSSLILAGNGQSPLAHALSHALNQELGNVGQTVVYTDPPEANPVNQGESLRELVGAMNNGQVDMLLILGANPVYNAPADLNFAEALLKVGFSVHLGLHQDETAALCQWHVPARHYLESWGDALAFDGTVTLMQPLVEPLYADSRSAQQLLAALLGQSDLTDYDIVHHYWAGQVTDGFETFWKQARHDGLIVNTALPAIAVTVDLAAVQTAAQTPPRQVSALELVFRPDPTVWDGRFANNGWLQELPKPLTKLTWDNAAFVSPATAERLGLSPEEVVELIYNGRTVQAPVWVMPGQANETVTLHLGYGREQVGRVGNGIGVNAYALRTAAAPWAGSGLQIRATGQQYRLATTQMHYNMEGRDPVRAGTLDLFKEDPQFPQHMAHEAPEISLMPQYDYDSYAWGMVVDLNVCNGCNACVAACQAENNIPIVGKEQVLVSREMHWIRVDTYFEGNLDNPTPYHQPMLCQHCEQAPCEVVCPVGATVHDHEGLNVMVYNRCIGTRYCSNNCPYKVRRYNFLQFSDQETETLKMQRNPDVTVRVRGVMEKCSYCVQRISHARIEAKKEGRRLEDGEVVTACQAACPTHAIVFGDVNDPNSRVSQLKAEPHHYGVLTELGTRPRTTYLAKLKNPNPELEG